MTGRAGGAAVDDRRIRSLRAPKPAVDPLVAHGSLIEDERRPGGTSERALTIFLAGSECPFTCSFCDLWKWTFDGPTPPGALPRQIAGVLDTLDRPLPDRIKLYNASNWFDRRAVPAEDGPAIVELLRPFAGVTVESHASLVGDLTLEFVAAIPGRLEVAMGLETIHPAALRQLNKRLDLDRFDKAARLLADNDIDLRVFVLLGPPHVPPDEAVEWAVRSAEYAAERGAAVVSIIPVRGGNGELERLRAEGLFTPPRLVQLEAALDACHPEHSEGSAGLEVQIPRFARNDTVITADLWDVELFPACASCRDERVARMRRMNVSGRVEPAVVCMRCRGL